MTNTIKTKKSYHETKKAAYEYVSGLYHLAARNGQFEILNINIYEDIEEELWIVERTIEYVEN